MPRPRSVDRESLLDAAEATLAAEGLAGLSFGAVATASGAPKATVQSAFGSRDALIAAVLGRWLEREQARFDALLAASRADGCTDEASLRTRAHIRSTARETAQTGAQMVHLLSALASTGQAGGGGASAWYAARAGGLRAANGAERRLRLAFFAAEGAFYVRHLVGLRMSQALWRDIFEDILALAAPELPASSKGPAQGACPQRRQS